MVHIDLGELTKGEVHMLTGHPRGLKARELYGLDDADKDGDVIVIVAPKDLDIVTPSFVQGLLARSVNSESSKELTSRIDLSNLPRLIRDDFETGIERVLALGVPPSGGPA